MVKRITESRLKKAMVAAGVVGVPLGIYLITFLVSLGAIEVIDHSGDIITNADTVFINVTFKVNEDIFIYPMDSKFALEIDNKEAIKLIKMYRTWGKTLYEIKMNETCKSTWCGGKRGVTDNAYSFALREGKTYTFVYEIQKTNDSIIKWSWLDGKVDPFVVGYEYLYKTYLVEVPVYKNTTVIIKTNCDEKDADCSCEIFKNLTKLCTKPFSYIRTEFDYYDYKERNTDEVNGVLIGTKKYKNNNGIYLNEKESTIEQCNVPVGERNWKEHPLRQYEIDKGFCWKTKLDVVELTAELSR